MVRVQFWDTLSSRGPRASPRTALALALTASSYLMTAQFLNNELSLANENKSYEYSGQSARTGIGLGQGDWRAWRGGWELRQLTNITQDRRLRQLGIATQAAR